jgi:hypothetical protein
VVVGLRVLYLLMFLRMLAPPGVCLCKLGAPAVAFLSGQPVPVDTQAPDDDHAPGCPCSPLAAGMGLRAPTETPPPPDPSLDQPPPAPPLLQQVCRLEQAPALPAPAANATLVEISCLLLI